MPALSKGSTAYPRRLLSMFILLAVVSLSLVLCQLGRSQKVNFEGTPRERILRLLEEHPLIDSHNDLPEHIYGKFKNRIEGVNLSDLSSDFHTDWTRLRQGRLSVQIWSAYVPCTKVDIWSDAVPRTFVRALIIKIELHYNTVKEQMDLIKRMISAYPKDLQWAQSTRDIHSAFKSGRIASLIGIEGSHQVGDSVAVLRMAYDLGARYLTLTHTCHTGWADSCASPGPHGGLSKSGREAVLEMNRLVDLFLPSISSLQPNKQSWNDGRSESRIS